MTAPRFELTSQLQKVSRLPTEPPGRPDGCVKEAETNTDIIVLVLVLTLQSAYEEQSVALLSRYWEAVSTTTVVLIESFVLS